MMTRKRGFSLVEVLVALAVIGVAFGALSLAQVGNLQASARARDVSVTKAAANVVLEQVLTEVLATEVVCKPAGQALDERYGASLPDCTTEAFVDDRGIYYAFNDFYWSCPTVVSPLPAGILPIRMSGLECRDDGTIEEIVDDAGNTTFEFVPIANAGELIGNVRVTYAIRGLSGIEGEGILAISVTATHQRGRGFTLTLGDRVTCYDVYPTPTSEAPSPCPPPSLEGKGRPEVDDGGG